MLKYLLFFLMIPAAYSNDVAFEYASQKTGVSPLLIKAICFAESNHKVKAYNHGDGNTDNHAFGMCQVLYKTAVWLGMPKQESCKKSFKKGGLAKTYANCKLFGPKTNALYAAKYIKWQLNRYGNSWISAIAAYNTGSLKTCKSGKVFDRKGNLLYNCEKGGLLNQKYVDRVLDFMLELE